VAIGAPRFGKRALTVFGALLASSHSAFSAPARMGAGLHLPGGGSLPWTILVLLTVLTVIPAILLSMTPFVRILVVFYFLRQAIGTDTAPSNQVLIGLALFLTYFIMQPVGAQISRAAFVPMEEGHITVWQALDKSAAPMRTFMLKYTRQKDLATFVNLAKLPRPRSPKDLPIRVIVPAYIISELEAGFQIGLVLFLPFMVIDLVVASITTSVGMLQLPPVVISTPLKILLFVMVNGWSLVVGSLVKSFY
jgi:flagellar biosynthesis protein FliP